MARLGPGVLRLTDNKPDVAYFLTRGCCRVSGDFTTRYSKLLQRFSGEIFRNIISLLKRNFYQHLNRLLERGLIFFVKKRKGKKAYFQGYLSQFEDFSRAMLIQSFFPVLEALRVARHPVVSLTDKQDYQASCQKSFAKIDRSSLTGFVRLGYVMFSKIKCLVPCSTRLGNQR